MLLAPIKATGSETDPTYRYLRDLDTDAEDTEASRLLYVAATRAENRLHLLACLERDKDGGLKRPTAHTLLSRAWPVAESSFNAEQAHAAAQNAALPKEVYSINRLAAGWQMPELPKGARWNSPTEGRDEEQIEFSWAGETARHVGTVVHRWLQRMAQDELKGWDAKRVDALIAGVRRELLRRGLRTLDSQGASELVRLALHNSVIDDRGRWLLGPHAEAHTEYRLRAVTNEGIRTYVADRFLRDSDGATWVVDYKTSRHEGAGVETFLDQEQRRYSKQLERYTNAIGGARAGLFFPLLRGWRET